VNTGRYLESLVVACALLGCGSSDPALSTPRGSGGVPGSGGIGAGADSSGVDTGGADSGGVDSGGADSGGADSGGADSGGADSGGADSGGADSGGADSGGADSGASGAAMCGNATCGVGEECARNACVCNAGLTRCDAAVGCFDLMTDPANCGMCGTACATGQVCAAGVCQRPPGDVMCPGGEAAWSAPTLRPAKRTAAHAGRFVRLARSAPPACASVLRGTSCVLVEAAAWSAPTLRPAKRTAEHAGRLVRPARSAPPARAAELVTWLRCSAGAQGTGPG
jgi:hypothetical protein